jgi:hypothetical protein
MNSRIERLRRASFEARPSISIERAVLETRFYQDNSGRHSLPVLRALCDLSADAQTMIDQAFGAGAHAKLFGEQHQPFMRSLALVTELAKAAGPVYDEMFVEYQPPASEPSTEI